LHIDKNLKDAYREIQETATKPVKKRIHNGGSMIVIDTFLFSEPSEKEVLLTKLHLGSNIVSEWIVSENTYTFRGEYKGLLTEAALNDPRFATFRDRIKVISSEIKYPNVNPLDKEGDKITFQSQYAQRDFVIDYLKERWGGQPNAWLLISDTDECLDGTTAAKRNKLKGWTRLGSDLLILDRRRFWFDFDNAWPAKRFTPLVRISSLTKWFGPGNSLGKIRGSMTSSWPSAGLRDLIYEYSACFDLAAVYRKYDTVGHVGMLREDLDRALACNHRPQFRIKGQQLSFRRDDWLERVRLSEQNSPEYVREHFESLHTGNIPDNYNENRRHFYPELFTTRGSLTRKTHGQYEDLRDIFRSARNRLFERRFPILI
jgi:hypothetical protein